MNIAPQLLVGASPLGAGLVVKPSVGSDWLRQLEAARELAWFAADQPGPDGEAAARWGQEASQAAPVEQDAGVATALGTNAFVEARMHWIPASAGMTGSATTLQRPTAALPAPITLPVAVPVAPQVYAAPPDGPPPAGCVARTAAAAPASPALAGDRAPATRRSHGAPPSPASSPPVRIHVEESCRGLVVWLGLDAAATAQGLRAQAVATELRRSLAASGQRLAAVICNGTALAGATPPLTTHDKER